MRLRQLERAAHRREHAPALQDHDRYRHREERLRRERADDAQERARRSRTGRRARRPRAPRRTVGRPCARPAPPARRARRIRRRRSGSSPRRRTRGSGRRPTSTTTRAASCARLVSNCGVALPLMDTLKWSGCADSMHEREEHLHRHDDDRRVPNELAEASAVERYGRVEDLSDTSRPQFRYHRENPNGRSRATARPESYSVRMIAASPWPPPPQSAAAPTPPPRRRSSLINVMTTRVPDMPIG